MEHLKSARKSPAAEDGQTYDTVARMLAEIEAGGEAKALEYCRTLDRWDGDVLVTPSQRRAAAAATPGRLQRDIQFAHERVSAFAEAQKNSIHGFEVELSPGLFAGQKLIPMTTAGCYVPGGRYV